MKYNIIKITLLTLVVILLSSCLPIPHKTQVIPKINGKITSNNIPLSDVKIKFYRSKHDKSNNKFKSVVFTDKNGMFYFKGDKDFHVYLVLGDPISTWSMDIIYNDTVYIGWKEFDIGYADESQIFICELTHHYSEKSLNQGICNLTQ